MGFLINLLFPLKQENKFPYALQDNPNDILRFVTEDRDLFFYYKNFQPTTYNICLKDKKIAPLLLAYDPLSLQNMSDNFRADYSLVMQAVKINGKSLRFASEKLKNDRNIFLESLKTSDIAIEYIGDKLARSLVIDSKQLLRAYPLLLRFSPMFQDDKETVLELVRIKGIALRYASTRLRNDSEVVIEAISQDLTSIEYATPECRRLTSVTDSFIDRTSILHPPTGNNNFTPPCT